MSFKQRRRLHRAVAEYLEGNAPELPAHLVPRLAHHWLHSLDEREPDAEGRAAGPPLPGTGRRAGRCSTSRTRRRWVFFRTPCTWMLGSGIPCPSGGGPTWRVGWARRACTSGACPPAALTWGGPSPSWTGPCPVDWGCCYGSCRRPGARIRFQLGLTRAPAQPDARCSAGIPCVRHVVRRSLPGQPGDAHHPCRHAGVRPRVARWGRP